jgi:hypothetical protein
VQKILVWGLKNLPLNSYSIQGAEFAVIFMLSSATTNMLAVLAALHSSNSDGNTFNTRFSSTVHSV